jgi:hypothetical protein
MDPIVARKMWRTLEPYHGLVYFAPEPHDAYRALGMGDRMMGYFASRAAPMGAVGAEVVIATFFNFYPDMVRKRIPEAWEIASPQTLIAARFEAADAMLQRVLGDVDVSEAARLARIAAEACTPEGRPLYAGHAGLEWPDEPHLQLWHATSLLREFRGDGHIAAMTVEGLDGCEALVTHAGEGEISRAALQTSRQWPDDEWDAAVERLRSRGWVNADGSFTDLGQERRRSIEDRTDELALRPWQALGEDDCTRLRQLVRPWSKAIVGSGELAFS